jgi:hypothetical protein
MGIYKLVHASHCAKPSATTTISVAKCRIRKHLRNLMLGLSSVPDIDITVDDSGAERG